MLSNNHNSCAFAEQIVSYIYDEATAKEREKFETHLLDCLPCSEEIAGFGLVRSSISEWRETEVYQPQTIEKASWLDGFRKILTFSPAWAGGFAALILCVGLIWLISGNSNEQVAANVTPQITPVAPIVDKQNNESILSPIEEKAFVNPKNETLKEVPQSVETVEKKRVAPKQNLVRASNTAPKSKSFKPKMDSAMANKTNNVQRQKTLTLSEVDGDEDNSLLLAELFDEIDSK